MNNNTPEVCEICELLPKLPESMTIDENELWLVNLGAQDQTCLGRTYITLKRHASELDELTDQEEVAFRVMRNNLIRAIREQFNPITFNVSCLKNDAFRSNPDTTPSSAAHVHWHVMPRYGTKPIEFAGETFRDPNPGRYLSPPEERKTISEEAAVSIVNAIKDSYPTH
jgi:diadenosine tetraphosphate (Ap4A) HIT family hydrolase